MKVFEKYNMWCKPKAVKTVTTDFKTDFTSKFHNLTSQPLLEKFSFPVVLFIYACLFKLPLPLGILCIFMIFCELGRSRCEA